MKELHNGSLPALFGLRAWRGAFFSANIHICFLAIFYLLLATCFARSSAETIALVFVLLAYYSYGFLVNDYFDMPYDRIVGKDQGVGKIPSWQTLVLLVALPASSLILAERIKGNSSFVFLLAFSFLLATSYSAPPVRFKSRGILGFICDSTIEKPLPVLLVFLFFQRYGPDMILFAILADTIQFHTVLTHQMDDREDDARTVTKTFAVEIGEAKARRVLFRVFYPLNALSMILWTVAVAYLAPIAIVGVGIGAAILIGALLALRVSESTNAGKYAQFKTKLISLAGEVYSSRQMPLTIAYLNPVFEGLITVTLGLHVIALNSSYAPLVILFLGSMYFYSGMYILLGSYLLTLLKGVVRS